MTDAHSELPTEWKQPVERLYWFFRMIDSGGPDGSELDDLVYAEAEEAASLIAGLLGGPL